MKYDIAIVGAGVVGLTLAIALAKKTSLSVVLLESQTMATVWQQDNYHPRVSAISLASQRIFQSLGVWSLIKAKRVSPFKHIQVWDEANHADVKFASQDIAESVLGFILENNAMQSSLEEKLSHYPQVKFIRSIKLADIHENDHGIELSMMGGSSIKANLVVAADGAHSWLRDASGVAVKTIAYEQTAIVATVATTLPHQQTARQVFLATGPLAFLPLAEETLSSIVWSLPTEEAEKMLALEDGEFNDALTIAFAQRLGSVTTKGKRYAFPLQQQQATHYIRSRMALIGDAAHTVHPLAGQGVNMGLLDAASLVDIIVNALQQHRDYSSLATLRQYERWRKADNFTMMTGVHAIASVQPLRSVGLIVTNYMQWLKNIFIRHAVGNRGALPTLAQ